MPAPALCMSAVRPRFTCIPAPLGLCAPPFGNAVLSGPLKLGGIRPLTPLKNRRRVRSFHRSLRRLPTRKKETWRFTNTC